MSDVLIVPIEFIGSLYHPASSEFISRLEHALGAARPASTVVIKADFACHDYHQDWLEGLTRTLYWEDLAAHFQRVHLALVNICLSKAKWYFLSGQDCLGSWWDLALACHGRIWANPYAKVGFPEIYIDMIPPFTSAALRRFDAYQSTDSIRKNAILHAKDAYALGLMSLVLQGPNWTSESGIENLISWIKKTPLRSNLRSTTKKELLDETPDILGVVENRSILGRRRRQIAVSHLDAGFSLLKERNVGARAIAMSQVRAGCAARVLFEDYRSWLSRRISRYELGARDKWWTGSGGLLVVDLSLGIPPQSLIYTLLSRKIRLVLVSRSEDHLKESLETILSRFQKNGTSRKDLLASWRGRLDWFVGDVSQSSSLWMACPANELIHFGVGKHVIISRYRLSGNFGHAILGWCEEIALPSLQDEVIDDSLKHGANEIADMLTNGVLRRQTWQHQISLAVCLRFCLLSEMLKLSETGEWPDLIDQCKQLAAAGWGFAGDIPQWDNLLRNFGQDSNLKMALQDLQVLSTEFPKNTSMVELRQRAPKTSSVRRLEISAARLSRHFEAFAVQTAERLLQSNFVESAAMADLFVTLAWGYPGKSPVPSELALAVGPARINFWAGTDPDSETV